VLSQSGQKVASRPAEKWAEAEVFEPTVGARKSIEVSGWCSG
jgi:hypothetical protein